MEHTASIMEDKFYWDAFLSVYNTLLVPSFVSLALHCNIFSDHAYILPSIKLLSAIINLADSQNVSIQMD